jgi:predicted protein tyrosine phosphatase
MNTSPLLPYPVTICGLHELAGHAPAGFSHVVSILDPDWPEPEAFFAYRPHRRLLLRFDDIVTPKAGARAPSEQDVEVILALGESLDTAAAAQVLIHCHAGVSRSTAAAVILMARRSPGREADIFAEIRRIRPKSWPNAIMVAFADAMLDSGGVLIAALKDHQRQIVREFPEFAEMLLRSDRAHEIAALADDDAALPTLTELAAPSRHR